METISKLRIATKAVLRGNFTVFSTNFREQDRKIRAKEINDIKITNREKSNKSWFFKDTNFQY